MLFWIEEFLTAASVCGCITAFICLMVRLFKKEYRGEWRRDICMAAFTVYITFLIIVELTPISVMRGDFYAQLRSQESFWTALDIPLFDVSQWQYSFALPSSWGDVWEYRHEMLLFAPFGFLLPLLWEEMNPKAVPLGLYVIAGIEILQLPLGRVFDAGDILMEFIAVSIGYGLYFGFSYLFPNAAKKIIKSKRRW